jgi:hypothetical protein
VARVAAAAARRIRRGERERGRERERERGREGEREREEDNGSKIVLFEFTVKHAGGGKYERNSTRSFSISLVANNHAPVDGVPIARGGKACGAATTAAPPLPSARAPPTTMGGG